LIKNLFEQKKYADAETEARTLVEHSERALGPDGVTTINGRISLALATSEQGRHDEALKLLRALREDATRVLGVDDADTLRIEHTLGTCLNTLKQHNEAATLLSRVLEARNRALPADDLATLDTRHQLGIALLKQGKFKEALAEIRITSIACQRLLKADDPRNAAINQTATEFSSSKEGKQILIDEQLDLVAQQAKKLGQDSLKVLNLRLNAAVFMNTIGCREESLAEYQKALDSCLHTLGLKSLGTVDVMEKVGVQQLSMGKFAEAEKSLRQAFDLRQKLVKQGDLSIEEARYYLGVCLGQMGRIKESHEMIEKCYLAIKDRQQVNTAFVQQTKNVLDQLTQMLTQKKVTQPSVQNAAATIQQPIQIPQQKTSGTPVMMPGTVNSSIPSMNPSSLVPAGTIQKPLEFKP
jgi:tetratricopeptide (TPR) repeat protein